MSELKPCRHCGGEAKIYVQQATGCPSGDNGYRGTVMCQNRECSISLVRWALKREWAEKTVIAAWNRHPPAHKYTLEELREMVGKWVWVIDGIDDSEGKHTYRGWGKIIQNFPIVSIAINDDRGYATERCILEGRAEVYDKEPEEGTE